MEKRVWKSDEIKKNILVSDIWLTKAILAIYKKQTESEKASETTHLYNKVGFSAFDAKRLSYYAKWLLSGRKLSSNHLDTARKRIIRYSKQLAKIANGEI